MDIGISNFQLPPPLPCPHCGENQQAQRHDPLQNLHWVMCKACLCQGPPHPDIVESIDVWNMRIENAG